MTVYGERIAVLEVEMKESRKEFKVFEEKTEVRFDSIESKLDEILVLKNKAVGVFILLSFLASTGVAAIVYFLP